MPRSKFEELVAELSKLSEALSGEDTILLPSGRAKNLRDAVSEAYLKLRKVLDDLDPISHPGFVFDPSNPNVAGRIAGIVLVAQPRRPLAGVEAFYGSGVYAIYYSGDFPAYRAISKMEHPIYVGKADPVSAASKTVVEQGSRLWNRLKDHRRNLLKASTTLNLDDFEYRALVVQTGWQGAAEDFLIDLFKPIWNGICYGFGKHGDDPGTRANLRSPWDTLHPGRDWAHRDPDMKDAKSADELTRSLTQHFDDNPVFGSIDDVLRRFMDEMRAVS